MINMKVCFAHFTYESYCDTFEEVKKEFDIIEDNLKYIKRCFGDSVPKLKQIFICIKGEKEYDKN